MKTAERPAGMRETPRSGTALPNALELSSIFHPARSTGSVPTFVTSNQSAAYGALPLLHGLTSETISCAAIVPGDPMAVPSNDANAPLTPLPLNVETAERPAALSKLTPVVEPPNVTPVIRW